MDQVQSQAQFSRGKALGFTAACIVSWAFIPVIARFGQASLNHYQLLFWSNLCSLAVVFVCTLLAGKQRFLTKYSLPQMGAAFGLGFLGMCLYYLLLYYGYKHAPSLEVLVLQYSWPVFVVVLSVPLLHERISLNTCLALALGFGGIVLILSGGQWSSIKLENLSVGLVVLGGAFTFGLYTVLGKKSQLEPFSVTTYSFLSATICSALTVWWFSSFAWPTGHSWIFIGINGALINGISYIFWFLALRHGRASFVAPFVFLTPGLATLLCVVFFQEHLLPMHLLGMGAVVASGLATQWSSGRGQTRSWVAK